LLSIGVDIWLGFSLCVHVIHGVGARIWMEHKHGDGGQRRQVGDLWSLDVVIVHPQFAQTRQRCKPAEIANLVSTAPQHTQLLEGFDAMQRRDGVVGDIEIAQLGGLLQGERLVGGWQLGREMSDSYLVQPLD
jgi:hypothetical protein